MTKQSAFFPHVPLQITHPIWRRGQQHAVVHSGAGKVIRPHSNDIAGVFQFEVDIKRAVSISWSAWGSKEDSIVFTKLDDIVARAIPKFSVSPSPLNSSSCSGDYPPIYKAERIWDSIVLGQGNSFDEVRFLVVNGPRFPHLGRLVRKSGARKRVSTSRLEITESPWQVILDQEPEANTPCGQYRISHYGLLRRTDHRSFGHEKAQQVLQQLMLGLTFIGGRRCGLLLPLGMRAGQIQSLYLNNPRVDPLNLKGLTWYTSHILAPDIEALLGKIMTLNPKILTDEITRTALYYASQSLMPHIEAGLTHAIAGLEYLCDDTNLSTEAKNGEATVKIGALADYYKLPGNLKDISALNREAKKWKIKPQSHWTRRTKLVTPVVWARNQHMHGKVRNRHSLPDRMWFDAWILSSEWLAIVLLQRLNYSGKYLSRLGKFPKPDYELSDLPKMSSSKSNS
jgi:hypothetical protein